MADVGVVNADLALMYDVYGGDLVCELRDEIEEALSSKKMVAKEVRVSRESIKALLNFSDNFKPHGEDKEVLNDIIEEWKDTLGE